MHQKNTNTHPFTYQAVLAKSYQLVHIENRLFPIKVNTMKNFLLLLVAALAFVLLWIKAPKKTSSQDTNVPSISQSAKNIEDQSKNSIDNLKNSAQTSIENVKQKTKQAVKKTKQAGNDLKDKVVKNAQKAGNDLKNTATLTKEKTSDQPS